MNTTTARTLAAALLLLAAHTGFDTQAATPRTPSAAVAAAHDGIVTTRDGVRLYYKDWGPKDGPVVTFSHGWPLSSSPTRATASSPTIVAAMAVPASPGTATTWTTTPTISPR